MNLHSLEIHRDPCVPRGDKTEGPPVIPRVPRRAPPREGRAAGSPPAPGTRLARPAPSPGGAPAAGSCGSGSAAGRPATPPRGGSGNCGAALTHPPALPRPRPAGLSTPAPARPARSIAGCRGESGVLPVAARGQVTEWAAEWPMP